MEVGNLVILTIFVVWIPYCFQDMPSLDQEGEKHETSDTSLSPRRLPKEVARQEQQRQELTELMPKEECERDSGEPARPLLSSALQGEAEASVSQEGGKEEPAEDPCDLQKHSGKFSLLPFLVAFLAGGIFSLEAFEAFPML